MATKTISIMEDAYKLLVAKKAENESFSEVIRRKFREKRDIMEFAGVWKNISAEDARNMKERIKELRKKSTEELKRTK